MATPDDRAVIRPLLRFASDQQEHSLWAVVDALSRRFDLTDEERPQLLPSGQQTVFYDGRSLAQAMVDLNVGVTTDRLYEVK